MKKLLIALLPTISLYPMEKFPTAPSASAIERKFYRQPDETYIPRLGNETRFESLEDFTINELLDLECRLEGSERDHREARLQAHLQKLKNDAQVAVLKEAAAERQITLAQEIAREEREMTALRAMIANQQANNQAALRTQKENFEKQLQEHQETTGTQITYLKWGLAGVSTALAALSIYTWYQGNIGTELEELRREKTELKADLSNLQRDVNNVKNETKTNKSELATIKTDITTLKSDTTTLKSDVNTLKKDVAETKANAEKFKLLPTFKIVKYPGRGDFCEVTLADKKVLHFPIWWGTGN